MAPALALGLAVLAGCSFTGSDYGGTEYRCAAGETCPDGFRCDHGVCLAHDAAPPDARPVGQPDSAATTDCPDNILANPSFENGTDGWGGVGGPLTQVSESHDGEYAAQRCYDGSQAYYNINDNPDSVIGTQVGVRYGLSAWLRSDNEQLLAAVIRVKNSIGGSLEQSSTDVVLRQDWTEVTVDHVVADSDGAFVEVYFSNTNPAQGDCFQLDHVCFRSPP